MSNRAFTFWQAVPKSFYDAALFRDVSAYWPGLGFGYLLMLHLLVMGPLAVGLSLWISTITLSAPYDFEAIIRQAPTMRIVEGEASLDAQEPYTISDPETGRALIIFDTTRPTADTLRESEAIIVVGKHEFLMRKGRERETRMYTYPKDESLAITQDTWRGWALMVLGYAWILPLALLPFFVVVMAAYRFVQCVLYALFGLLIARAQNVALPYETVLRLAAVAITPVVVLDVGLLLLGIHFPAWLAFVLAVANLYLAIHANRVRPA